ncbi:MAG: solute carrier family 23 protein [Pseudomonadota bacterium]
MDAQTPTQDLLFGLNDRPPWPKALLAAIAHLLAIVASIATAPLLIAQGLNLDVTTTSYVISSALIVSGIATLIQVVRVGPFGSGLLSIQGTSFAFIGAFILAGGALASRQLDSHEMVGTLLGSAAVCALLSVVAGFYVQHLARVVTPNVTGITIFLLGLTLVWVAIKNFRFTLDAVSASDLPVIMVWLQAIVVISVILFFSTRSNPWLRLASICLGLLIGMLFAVFTGSAQPLPEESLTGVTFIQFMPFPLGVDFAVCLLLLPIFFVTIAESIGDLTATSMLSKQPLTGPDYWKRIRGGVMADGMNSVIASLAGTFPNTTFSQNNGVIYLTGVASRLVGGLVAVLLIVLGALPGFVALFQSIPGGVLHSATGLLFAMIAVTGFRLLRAQENQARAMRMLIGCSILAFALTYVPSLLASVDVSLPDSLAILFGFPVASGALIALLWEWSGL